MEYRDKTIPELEKYIDEMHDTMRRSSDRIISLARNDSTPGRQIECMLISIELLKGANPVSYPFIDENKHIVMHD